MARRLQSYDQPPTWKDLDLETQNEFMQDGDIEFIDWYFSNEANTNTYYDKEHIDFFMKAIERRQTGGYGICDYWLYSALDDHSIEDKDVAVIGSCQPWYESVCLGFGGRPHTIEYNKLTTNDPRLTLYTVEEYTKNPRKFQAAFSISSFEHDGLGRFGDPINPNGDLRAMKEVRETILEPGGLLFLSVPNGVDKVCFNAHRIYGNKRYYKLIEGFEIVDYYPKNFKEMLEVDTGSSCPQPVVVLRNKG